MSPTTRLPRAFLAFAFVALLCTQSLSAQTIGGKVVEAGTGKPIPGALVVLLDAGGEQRAAVLTDAAGHFFLRAPGAGRYTLRTDRIGFRSVTSPELTVAANGRLSQRIEAPIEPIVLDTISASGSGRCHTPRDVGAATYLLWEEARKALDITALERERGMPYQVLQYKGTRSLVGGDIEQEQSRLHSAYGRTPFRSEPAKSLAEYGFVRSLGGDTYMYYGLDAPTLLSDAFLDTHCFRVRQPGPDAPGLIGLGFEPTPDNHNPDIAGTLWLDRNNAELRFITFHFTRHLYPIPLPTEPFGGRVEFRRLSNGAWIVDRWWLRMPQVPSSLLHAGVRAVRPTDTHVDAILAAQRAGVRVREKGGEVRFVAEPGLLIDAFGDAAAEGTVYDSTRDIPLAGATVFFTDVRRSATTDEHGRFRLAGVPAGTHGIAFLHPYADSLDLPVRPREVVLQAGRTTRVDLAIPRASGCPESRIDARHGAITGFVWDAAGKPVAHAVVVAKWRSANTSPWTPGGLPRKASTRTDGQGRFLLCGFPVGQSVALTTRDGTAEATAELKIEDTGIARQDLLVKGDR